MALYSEFSHLKFVIFHSYVSLPEGTSIVHMFFLIVDPVPGKLHWFSMILRLKIRQVFLTMQHGLTDGTANFCGMFIMIVIVLRLAK